VQLARFRTQTPLAENATQAPRTLTN